jgi:hypothetical protein
MFGKIKYALIITGLLACFYACVKKKTFSQSPEIEYKSFTPYGLTDTADLVLGFSDGDGDIGKDKEDKTNNLFYTFYYFDTVTKVFRADYNAVLNDTTRVPYTIRKPIDDYNGKPISGEIAIKINGYRGSKTRKRIKYVLYMFDNANHKSNVLTTPEIQVP